MKRDHIFKFLILSFFILLAFNIIIYTSNTNFSGVVTKKQLQHQQQQYEEDDYYIIQEETNSIESYSKIDDSISIIKLKETLKEQLQNIEELEKEIEENLKEVNSKPLTILVMDEDIFNKETKLNSFSKCPELNCLLTFDRNSIKSVDGILYFLPRYLKPSYKYPISKPRENNKQLLFGWSMESPLIYKHLDDDNFVKIFNITIGYTRISNDLVSSSHIYTPYGPIPYNGSDHYTYKHGFNKNKEIPLIKRKNKIMWLSSNCKRDGVGRINLVSSMMNFTGIDSYGICLHNKDLKVNHGGRVQLRSSQKLELMQDYNFVISIENSRCQDYVTEKLWEVLSIGAIPIYLGAPNILEFLPDPDAIINIADFTSVYELIEYINLVDNNDSLRLKHLQWKSKPFPDKFNKLLMQSYNNLDLMCNMCKKIVEVSSNSSIQYTPLKRPFRNCTTEIFNLPLFPNKYNSQSSNIIDYKKNK